jgi:hypothetical protein
MIYKDRQKKNIPTPLSQNLHSSSATPTNNILYVTYGQVTKQNSYTPTQIESIQYTNQPHQQNMN